MIRTSAIHPDLATRRALVLTDEAARHPFLSSLPAHVRRDAQAAPVRSKWFISRQDIRGFASAYVATVAAVLIFIF